MRGNQTEHAASFQSIPDAASFRSMPASEPERSLSPPPTLQTPRLGQTSRPSRPAPEPAVAVPADAPAPAAEPETAAPRQSEADLGSPVAILDPLPSGRSGPAEAQAPATAAPQSSLVKTYHGSGTGVAASVAALGLSAVDFFVHPMSYTPEGTAALAAGASVYSHLAPRFGHMPAAVGGIVVGAGFGVGTGFLGNAYGSVVRDGAVGLIALGSLAASVTRAGVDINRTVRSGAAAAAGVLHGAVQAGAGALHEAAGAGVEALHGVAAAALSDVEGQQQVPGLEIVGAELGRLQIPQALALGYPSVRIGTAIRGVSALGMQGLADGTRGGLGPLGHPADPLADTIAAARASAAGRAALAHDALSAGGAAVRDAAFEAAASALDAAGAGTILEARRMVDGLTIQVSNAGTSGHLSPDTAVVGVPVRQSSVGRGGNSQL